MGRAAALPLDLPQARGSFGAVRLTYSQGRSKRIRENFGVVDHGSLDSYGSLSTQVVYPPEFSPDVIGTTLMARGSFGAVPRRRAPNACKKKGMLPAATVAVAVAVVPAAEFAPAAAAAATCASAEGMAAFEAQLPTAARLDAAAAREATSARLIPPFVVAGLAAWYKPREWQHAAEVGQQRAARLAQQHAELAMALRWDAA